MDRLVQLSDFEHRVGSSFRLTTHDELSFDVELVNADRLVGGPHEHEASSFSLLFKGPLEHKLPQMIRHLEHPDLGGLDIFLVPVEEDEEGRYYEAVFSYID